MIELAIYTGFRLENILGMRIESIRFHDLNSTGEIEHVVKGGKKEVFPLSPAAVEVISCCKLLFLLVGVVGFEPTASCSRSMRANRAALHPD